MIHNSPESAIDNSPKSAIKKLEIPVKIDVENEENNMNRASSILEEKTKKNLNLEILIIFQNQEKAYSLPCLHLMKEIVTELYLMHTEKQKILIEYFLVSFAGFFHGTFI